MARVAVLTDSSACVPQRDRHPVRVLPIRILLPDADIDDGVEGAGLRVYDALSRGVAVKSSAPSAAEYLAGIEEARAEAVVVVTPAEEFTSMFRNASAAAALSDRPVAVLDSRTAAAAQGLVALAAADAASRGEAMDAVVETARDAAGRAELVAALDSLEFVRRSGRVAAFALELARHLGVRPVFRFRGGEVERIGVPTSVEGAVERIRREWGARGGHRAQASLVFHAAAPDRAARLAQRLGDGIEQVEFSPSMGIHTGPGVVGVAWLRPDGGSA